MNFTIPIPCLLSVLRHEIGATSKFFSNVCNETKTYKNRKEGVYHVYYTTRSIFDMQDLFE